MHANNTNFSKKSSAFTLIELLTVLAVIAVLVGMLLPAVQSARESARRVSCQNKVKQIALATINFASVKGRLPVAVTKFEPNRFGGMTWLTRLLPYLEQGAVWSQANDDYQSSPNPFTHAGLQRVMPIFLCPSDPTGSDLHFTHEDLLVAQTNYLGVNGTNYQLQDGMFTGENKVDMRDVRDGLSNTLLMGERPPSSDYWYGWWYASGQSDLSTGDVTLGVAELNPSGAVEATTYLEDCPSGPFRFKNGLSTEQCSTLHFWSHHPNGANFALGDGAVKFLVYQTEDQVMRDLATRDGGEVVSLP